MKVTLKKNHKHAGQPVAAGSSIDVLPHDALWLNNQGLIEESVEAIEAEAKKINHKLHAPLLAEAKAKASAAKTAPQA